MRGSLPVTFIRPAPPVVVAIVASPGEERFVALLTAAIAARLGSRVKVACYAAASPEAMAEATRRALAEGCDVLAPVGGDEVLGDVLAASAGQEVPVLLMPFGASEEHARAVGHRDVSDVVAALDRGRVRRVDMVRCSFRGADGRAHRAVVCPPTGHSLVSELRRSWEARPGDAAEGAPRPRLTGLEMIAEALPLLCRPATA